MSHTPGPWTVKIDAHDRGQIYSHSGAWIGTAWRHLDEDDTSLPSVDNARMMAASPDGHEILMAIHEFFRNYSSVNPSAFALDGERTLKVAVAEYIAKATGQ